MSLTLSSFHREGYHKLVQREPDRFHDALDDAGKRDAEALSVVKQIVEILGPRPEKGP